MLFLKLWAIAQTCVWMISVADSVACLPDAIDSTHRRNLTFKIAGKEVTTPFLLGIGNWASGEIVGTMVKTFAEEVFGVHVETITLGQASTCMFMMLGCQGNNKDCPEERSEPLCHTFMEAWSFEGWVHATRPQIAWFDDALTYDKIGYSGREGASLLGSTIHNAYALDGFVLEFYKSFDISGNSSWKEPWKYFTTLSEWDEVDVLKNCSEVGFFGASYMSRYVDVTGDVDGVEETGRAKCWGDTWWWSPECRRLGPRNCIVALTAGSGWFADGMMMIAVAYKIPIALATAKSMAVFEVLLRAKRTIFYSWTPDPLFIDIAAQSLVLPEHDPVAFAAGDYRTQSPAQTLYKLVSGDLQQAANIMFEFLQRFTMPDKMIGDLLLQSQHDSMQNLTCKWIKANRELWQTWILSETDCFLGQGLVGEQGVYLQSRELAIGCEWCPAGRSSTEFSDSLGTTHICERCPPGQHLPLPGQAACLPCKPGSYNEEWAAVSCKACPPGKANQLHHQIQCQECERGHMSSRPGELECTSCPLGTAAGHKGSTACPFCSAGSFAAAQGLATCTSCSSVLNGSESIRGSSRASECICPAGTYLFPAIGCVDCLAGLVCPGTNEVPLQEAGFWVQVIDATARDYSVYACRNKLECPRGTIGACAAGRAGDCCNNCKDQHYPNDDGSCMACEPSDSLPLIAVCVMLPLGAVALAVALRMDAGKQQLTSVTVALTAGQLVTAFQALGALHQLSIQWSEPFATMIASIGILAFDLDALQVSCVLSQNSPVPVFVMKLASYPIFAFALILVYFVSKAVKRPVDSDKLFNLNGMCLFVLFISITLSVLLPFQCRSNPNGKLTMATHPGLICYESGDHLTLTILAGLGTLAYPIAILSWVLYITACFKQLVTSSEGMVVLRRYRFLFARFNPKAYFFGAFFLVRNGLVALIPVLLVELASVQTLAMGAVILAGATMQNRWWPWRTHQANCSDLGMNALILLMILGAAPMLNVPPDEASTVLGVLLSVLLVGLSLLAVVSMGLALYHRFWPKKYFSIFLCHHKVGAGALGRQMKMSLGTICSGNVFLDSDQLEDLDLIFDVVRSSTDNLVVLLSPELLKRMWCAGEIVTAHINNTPIVPVILNGFVPPSEKEIQDIVMFWTEDQRATLLEYDINIEMIKTAYKHLLQCSAITLDRFESLDRKNCIIEDVAKACNLRMRVISRKMRTPSEQAKALAEVLVTGAVADVETLAACEIVQILIQEKLQVEVRVARSVDDVAKVSHAKVLVVLLSPGLLHDATFARLLLQVFGSEERVPHIVTLNSGSSFQFPTGEFYHDLVQNGLGLPGLGPEKGQLLSTIYKSLLSILALPFSPLASEGLIAQQVLELCVRLKKLLQTPKLLKQLPTKEESSERSQNLSITEEDLFDL